jgi:hypothetical protein
VAVTAVVAKPAPPAPDAEPPAPPAPTIQVTIGRVEIRAASTAPIAKKSSPRPPALTLEQYLKQRRGASRE